VDALRTGTAAIAFAGMVAIGMGMHSTPEPTPVTAVQALPAPAPDAYDCAVHCEVHLDDIGVEPLSLPRLATGKDIGAPIVPSVVLVPNYISTPLATPGSTAKAASAAPRASKAPKPSSSKAAKAPKQPKAPTGPSTTVTDRTVTGPKGTTTTHTVVTKGLPVSAGQAATSTGG
jgi:hypothetical protein